MKTFTKLTSTTLLLYLQLGIIFPASAQVLYENNYDSGKMPKFWTGTNNAVSDGQPVWTLPPIFQRVYGPGNHFNLSNTSSHSGKYSLRFTYNARNGMCNTCGLKFYKNINNGINGVNYFIDSMGTNLSIADNPATSKPDDGPKARPGRFVYDTDNGFSKWEITSVTNKNAINDRLNLKLVTPGIHDEKTINRGDSIGIARQCGVDGIIGISGGKNMINRRSDCNIAILWFSDVTPQTPGSSIFRREYLKANVVNPTIHQKLHYLVPGRGEPDQGSIVIFGDSNKQTAPYINVMLSGLKQYGGDGLYRPSLNNGFEGLKFKRDTWYYVEEEYQAATLNSLYDPEYNPKSKLYNINKYPNPDPTDPRYSQYNNDGAYRLWFSKSGAEPTTKATPTFKLERIPLPPITANGPSISFWGNVQHETNAYGSWYIDDVKISNSWNGPVPFSGTNTPPPESTTINSN